MIEINYDEAATYDFSLEIGGDASGKPEIRFSIVHPTGYAINFPTKVLESGTYQVSLPILRGLLPPGEHFCMLEVIMGDRYFKPLLETLKILQPITASVFSFKKTSGETIKPTVTATVKESKPVDPPFVKVVEQELVIEQPKVEIPEESEIEIPEESKSAVSKSTVSKIDLSEFDALLKSKIKYKIDSKKEVPKEVQKEVQKENVSKADLNEFDILLKRHKS